MDSWILSPMIPAKLLDLLADPKHLLVHRVDLRVLDHEVAPESSSDKAQGFRSSLTLQTMLYLKHRSGQTCRQGPLHHLLVGGGGKVNPAERGKAAGALTGRNGSNPISARLQKGEESFDPLFRPPALFVGPGPESEFLAVIPHYGDPISGAIGLSAQPFEYLVRLLPGDDIAEGPAGGKDLQGVTLLLCNVITEKLLFV